MLDSRGTAANVAADHEWWKESVAGPLTTASVGRWQREMSADAQRFAALHLCGFLREHGYEGAEEPRREVAVVPVADGVGPGQRAIAAGAGATRRGGRSTSPEDAAGAAPAVGTRLPRRPRPARSVPRAGSSQTRHLRGHARRRAAACGGCRVGRSAGSAGPRCVPGNHGTRRRCWSRSCCGPWHARCRWRRPGRTPRPTARMPARLPEREVAHCDRTGSVGGATGAPAQPARDPHVSAWAKQQLSEGGG